MERKKARLIRQQAEENRQLRNRVRKLKKYLREAIAEDKPYQLFALTEADLNRWQAAAKRWRKAVEG